MSTIINDDTLTERCADKQPNSYFDRVLTGADPLPSYGDVPAPTERCAPEKAHAVRDERIKAKLDLLDQRYQNGAWKTDEDERKLMYRIAASIAHEVSGNSDDGISGTGASSEPYSYFDQVTDEPDPQAKVDLSSDGSYFDEITKQGEFDPLLDMLEQHNSAIAQPSPSEPLVSAQQHSDRASVAGRERVNYFDEVMALRDSSGSPLDPSDRLNGVGGRIQAFKEADRSTARGRSRAALDYVRALRGFADDDSEVLADGLSVDTEKNQLTLYSDLGWLGVDIEDVRDALAKLDTKQPVTIRLDSPGGDVFTGVGIFNLLVELANVTVIVDAMAASAASLIPLAATEVKIGLGAQVMIHEPWSITIGDAADHERKAQKLAHIRDTSLMDIYLAHLDITKDQLSNMLKAETWFSGEQLTPLLKLRAATRSDS